MSSEPSSEPPSKKPYQEQAEDPAVTRFRDYLRINTTSVKDYENPVGPQPDYDGAVQFLTQQANEIGLPVKVVEIVPRRPAVIMTLEGENPQLPSIMLNSHIDVVPAYTEHWECDPFAGVKKENGDIVARGTQDMKCCGMWYLEAMRKIKAAGKTFLRTIYLTFVPDEEVGGVYGMEPFIKMDVFKEMNVGFCLDEGLANPTDAFTVFYAERSPMWFSINCPGNPGHGSRFIQNTAAEKVRKILNHLLDFRNEQEQRLKDNPNLSLGDVTTLNVTRLTGGVQYNVVPYEMGMWVDIRISPTDDAEEVYRKLKEWVRDGGEDCTINFYRFGPRSGGTVIAEDTDPWWQVFTSTCEKHNMKYGKEIFPCVTDSRFVRELGIPCVGFSPINNTPILLHDHDEFINERVYLRGIPIYEDIISALASLKE